MAHGDYRIGNLVVREEGLAGVLDWEFAHLDDPVRDMAFALVRAWRFGAAAPVGGLCERERLAPQFVRIDEHRLERRISLRASHGLQGNGGERGRNFFGCVKHIAAR